MCYLVAKDKNKHGSYALKTKHGEHLAELKSDLNIHAAPKGIQLVTISRPTVSVSMRLIILLMMRQSSQNLLKLCEEKLGAFSSLSLTIACL
jgi:hypothetical protein